MGVIIGLVLLQFIIVFVTDYSGFPENAIKPLLNRMFGVGNPSKIFLCSLCQTTWLGIAYLLIRGALTLPNLALVLALAGLTPVTLDLIWFVRDFIQRVIGWLRYITGLDL